MSTRRSNMVAVSTASPLPSNPNRNYLMIVAGATPLVVTISGGTPFTIPVTQAWEPDLAPINDIAFGSADGTVVEG